MAQKKEQIPNRTNGIFPIILLLLIYLSSTLSCSSPQPKNVSQTESGISNYFEAVKKNPVELRQFLQKFPKGADLHNHLSGAMYAESYIEIAQRRNLCIDLQSKTFSSPPCNSSSRKPLRALLDEKTDEGFSRRTEIIDALSTRNFDKRPISGHEQFFSTFDRFFLTASTSRGDILAEATRRAAKQNILYLELMQSVGMFEVASLAQSNGNLDAPFGEKVDHQLVDQQVKRVSETLDQIEERRRLLQNCNGPIDDQDGGCDVDVRYLAQVIRVLPPIQVYAQILLAHKLIKADNRVVGLNLVAPEDHPVALRDYRQHMRWIAELTRRFDIASPGIALHAGELVLGLVPPKHLGWHIREAITVAGAKRIGHGIDIAHDDDMYGLLSKMRTEGVAVEINLTSNDVILGIKGSAHPFPTYLSHGVPLTLSTDDEGVSRIDLTHEYQRAVSTYDIEYKVLRALSRNALQYSFLPGANLFVDTLTGQRVSECENISVGAPDLVTSECRSFLDKNLKASKQWLLEEKIKSFEQTIGS